MLGYTVSVFKESSATATLFKYKNVTLGEKLEADYKIVSPLVDAICCGDVLGFHALISGIRIRSSLQREGE